VPPTRVVVHRADPLVTVIMPCPEEVDLRHTCMNTRTNTHTNTGTNTRANTHTNTRINTRACTRRCTRTKKTNVENLEAVEELFVLGAHTQAYVVVAFVILAIVPAQRVLVFLASSFLLFVTLLCACGRKKEYRWGVSEVRC
jgi:hypothetical protein